MWIALIVCARAWWNGAVIDGCAYSYFLERWTILYGNFNSPLLYSNSSKVKWRRWAPKTTVVLVEVLSVRLCGLTPVRLVPVKVKTRSCSMSSARCLTLSWIFALLYTFSPSNLLLSLVLLCKGASCRLIKSFTLSVLGIGNLPRRLPLVLQPELFVFIIPLTLNTVGRLADSLPFIYCISISSFIKQISWF